MKRIANVILVLAASSPAFADHLNSPGNTYTAYGDVVATEPLYRTVVETTPREVCRTVRDKRHNHNRKQNNNVLPTLLGGLIGGAIGHQFGGGNGKKVATIAGAFAGASIAGSSATNRQDAYSRYQTHQRCDIVEDSREVRLVDGYRVTYVYRGNEFTREMDYAPGSKIQLNVSVEPVMDSYLPTSSQMSVYSSKHAL